MRHARGWDSQMENHCLKTLSLSENNGLRTSALGFRFSFNFLFAVLGLNQCPLACWESDLFFSLPWGAAWEEATYGRFAVHGRDQLLFTAWGGFILMDQEAEKEEHSWHAPFPFLSCSWHGAPTLSVDPLPSVHAPQKVPRRHCCLGSASVQWKVTNKRGKYTILSSMPSCHFTLVLKQSPIKFGERPWICGPPASVSWIGGLLPPGPEGFQYHILCF